MCPSLESILHLAEEQGTNREQKEYTCGACGKQFYFTANVQQHTGVKFCQCHMGRSAYLKSCTIHAARNVSTNMEIGNDFLANMGVQKQDTNTRMTRNNSKEYDAVFHSGKSHQSWGEDKIVSNPTDILVQDEEALTGEGFCEFSKCREACISYAVFCTRKFVPEKGLMNAAILENFLPTNLASLQVRDLTLEEHYMPVLNVESHLAKGGTSESIEKSTLEKSLINVRNVVNLSSKRGG